jgi:hypothetical protein
MPSDPSTPTQAAPRRTVIWSALAAAWLCLVVGGLVVVARYDNGAGRGASAHGHWPAQSRLVRDRVSPTLVLIAHPRCSCTRASLTELAEIMARTRNQARAYVVFAKPGRLSGDSEATALWAQASTIPHVSLVHDDDGREAAAFGAATSGQVFVYSTAGDLLFSGGTTPSRGHAGDNAGRRTIVALIRHEQPEQRTTPVFGCALLGPADQPTGTSGDAR